MLTDEQRRLIMQGIAKGFPDTQIAEKLACVTHAQVFHLRRSLEISAKTVLDNRYETWMKMLNSGIGLDLISEIYEVKTRSIQYSLWRAKSFSFVDAKKTAQQSINAKIIGSVKKGRKSPFDW